MEFTINNIAGGLIAFYIMVGLSAAITRAEDEKHLADKVLTFVNLALFWPIGLGILIGEQT